MNNTMDILSTHPHPNPVGPVNTWTDAMKALADCAATCMSCADACLAEEKVAEMRRCISTDIACGAVCHTTLGILQMQTERCMDITKAQIQAALTAVKSCAAECEKHATRHAHCRLCAQACRQAEKALMALQV